MFDFEILKRSTPVVYAEKIDYYTAHVPGKPLIHHKCFDFTEFIGEDLASIRNIRSAHYFPVCLGKKGTIFTQSNLRVGSYDFFESGNTYKFYQDFDFGDIDFNKQFLRLLEMCPSEKNRDELLDEFLELIALDTYMVQGDRSGNLLYEIHEDGEIHLAPVFDYEVSLDASVFNSNSKVLCDNYINDFFYLFDDDDYYDLMNRYPQFRDKLKSYLDVSLCERVRKVVKERRFNPDMVKFTHYELFDNFSHKRIKQLIR